MKTNRSILLILFLLAWAGISFPGLPQPSEKGVFTDLESALAKPAKVRTLILNDKNLLTLPESISGFKNLRSLSVQHNKELDIKDLFIKASKLKKLTSLDISYCGIKTLPPEVNLLKQLKRLRIGANNLTSLPSEISELTGLRELVFSQDPDNFRSFQEAEKRKIITALPECQVLLEDYFGGVHGQYRLGQKLIRITLNNLNSFNP